MQMIGNEYYEVQSLGSCRDGYVSIPGTHNGLPVKRLGYTFGCGGDMVGFIIPEGIVVISSSVIENCDNLKRITLPDSLEEIQFNCISCCESLERVSFGRNLRTIMGWSFYANPSCLVYDFTRCAQVPDLYWYFEEGDTFYGMPQDAKFIVPEELFETWRSATNWSYFADRIVAG